MNGHHLAAERCKRLTLELHAVNRVTHHMASLIQVEQALIAIIGGVPRLRDVHVAERLEGHPAVFPCAQGHHLFIGQLLRFAVASLEDELAHLRQVFACLRVEHLIGTARP